MQNSGYPFIRPSSTCIAEDLLFFDTFSHSGSEKDNFDLVQFPSPVIIDLIKIVPLGQPVEAKIPGNVRLGATNPSNCELEFFINDLSKQDAHTMTDLGKFYCNEKDTDFSPPLQVQTDGLLLRGSYRTLTLAIFGQIAAYDDKVEEEQAMLSAASPPAQTPASPVASEQDLPYIVRSVDQELLRRARDESELFEESTLKSGEILKENSSVGNVDIMEEEIMDLVESEPPQEPNNISEELSAVDSGPVASYSTRDQKSDEPEFSNSSDVDNRRSSRKESVKNLSETTDFNEPSGESSDADEEEFVEWSFNAETYVPESLLYFPDPSLTLQERSLMLNQTKLSDPDYCEAIEKEVEKVKEMFEVLNCSRTNKSDEWVAMIEDLINDLANLSLSQTMSNDKMIKLLVEQTLDGLNYEMALNQKQAGFKVRHLRAGLKLATILFHCGKSMVTALIEASVIDKVLELYNRDQMSLPLRLLIFKCLSAACDNVECVEYMISHKCNWTETCLRLDEIKRNVMEQMKKDTSEPEETTGPKFEGLSNDENLPYDQTSNEKKPLARPQSVDKQLETILGDENSLTCYQYLILIILSKPTTRVTLAIGNLLKKMRLYMNFAKLSSMSIETFNEETEDNVFEAENSMQKKDVDLERSVLTIQDMVQLMRDGCVEIAQPNRHLPARVQFQVKPNSTDTYLPIYRWLKHFDTLHHLNKLLDSFRSNSIDFNSDIEQSIRFQNTCLAFIQQLNDSHRGTQYLLSNTCYEKTAAILRTLANIHPPKRSSHVRLSDGIENCISASLSREESLAASSCRDTSLRMAFSLKVFSCIDKLFYFHRELVSKCSDFICDPERVLHQLYVISDHPYGLTAIVKHFSCIGNLDCLLRFLDVPDHHKHLEFVKETSIDYALELVGTFFRLNNNVLEIAEEYLDTLVELCKTKEKNLPVRIKSLLPWLNPFDTDQPFPLITYTEDTFRQLTRVIRKCIPDCSIPFAKALDFELPPQMITAVRILRQLCIPNQVESFVSWNFDILSAQKFLANSTKPASFMTFVDSLPHQQNFNHSWNLNLQLSHQNGANNLTEDSSIDNINQISNTFKLFQPYDENICGELKYHYGIMQVYEQEGLKRLMNTLRELTGNYPRPIYQSAALSGFRGRIVLSYINSVIVLLHSITCHLIDARGSEFKDTSIIPVVLETYSLLCFVPKPTADPLKTNDLTSLQSSITIRTDNYNLAQQTKKLIISILMSYAQMCLSVSESEEKVISKSMWTKMLKEVIDFTLSTPVFFQHGLDVLTQILPAPLPCSSMMDSIDQEQLFKNINYRKLWSAHLHPLHQQLEQMISSLSICYQSNIRILLYYLCNQLCDLSSNAACMVAKMITDTLLACAAKLALDPASDIPNNNESQQQSQNQTTNQQSAPSEDKLNNFNPLTFGAKESAYAVKMTLNLLSNLITNQAFETAFSNHLQVLGKKDEKLLANLENALKLHDDYKPGEPSEENLNSSGGAPSSLASVTHLVESIKLMNDNASKDGFLNPATNVAPPPEELTRINLLNVAHKSSDRFSLPTSLSKTYRLKVLLDLNSRAHRSSESSSKRFDHATYNYQPPVPSSHKPYASLPPPPPRSRARQSARPDSFRSRPQNTSRPPSIHVDDFIDLYGNSPAQSSSSSRFPSGASSGKMSASSDYRGSSSSRGYLDPMASQSAHGDPRHAFFNSQSSSGSPYGSRSQKAKYMKSK